ncbi:hypothetical protein CYY_006294 [Polysphondylium violaceum]|uniref:Ammonium transporter AmtB-like domain-containing protein n=1 Tax=Polysphondylium violaceum TaxID=133409 RepID=A0A8J4PRH2_9MYCE|nr:hypothetical protein CYY_006294 [Polysphondylium violaceum]
MTIIADKHTPAATSKRMENIIFLLVLFGFQIFMVVLYGVWVRYDYNERNGDNAIGDDTAVQRDVNSHYGYFRDINIMIFFGFGFLMTFLRRYGYSSLGYTFLVSAMVAQWSILVWGFFETAHHGHGFDKLYFNMSYMLNGLFCAGAVMISYGGVLGKVTPLQMIIMGIVEPIFFFFNMYIGELKLEAIDVGGGLYIHLFGCYFGLTLCWFLTDRHAKDSEDNSPSYNGDLFAMAGTLFLWMMWPSFNAAIAPSGDPQFRAIANTFLSLTGSTIATFLVSRLLGHAGHKLDMVHVQNSALAGGVVQGCCAHMNLNPGGAIGMGFIVGVISVLGYVYLTPIITRKLNIQDTCGINNLHGIPGFIGCIATVVAAQHGLNNKDLYGEQEFLAIFRAGDDQAKNNAAATFITIGVAIFGGIVTGCLMLLVKKIGGLKKGEHFNDSVFWHVPIDYPRDLDTVAADGHAYGLEDGGVEMTPKKDNDSDYSESERKSNRKRNSTEVKTDFGEKIAGEEGSPSNQA